MSRVVLWWRSNASPWRARSSRDEPRGPNGQVRQPPHSAYAPVATSSSGDAHATTFEYDYVVANDIAERLAEAERLLEEVGADLLDSSPPADELWPITAF